jgi:ABC-2 type transport system permease protein
MISAKRIRAVIVARNYEFIRDKGAFFWNLVMPVMLILGFAVIFDDEGKDLYKVAVYQSQPTNDPDLGQSGLSDLEFSKTKYIEFFTISDLDKSIDSIRRHQIDMVLDLTANQQFRYWVNDSSPNGYIVEKLLLQTSNAFVAEKVTGKQIRYVDWVLPGILGMNMMFSCLFGVGYVVVRYRKNGVLKRLKATPLTALEFIMAQVLSRFLLVFFVSTTIFIGCAYAIDFRMQGSYLDALIVLALGTVCLISLGLMIASRVKNEELTGGLLNLIIWPMMVLSGVWFSMEGAHPFVQNLAEIFPLTHMISAAREIMNNGASLLDVIDHVLILLIMSIVFLFSGAYLFRWD